MTVFKHRFTVKRNSPQKSGPKILVYPPAGIDGKQAGRSILKWERQYRKVERQ